MAITRTTNESFAQAASYTVYVACLQFPYSEFY